MLLPCLLRRLAFTVLAAALVAFPATAAPPPAGAPAARPFAPRAPSALPPGLHALGAEESGLTGANRFDDPRMWGERFREFTLGALETGVAVADVDGDGRLDIFAVSKTGPCALYRQTGPLRFTDVAAAAGVTGTDAPAPKVGATFVDLNQDGAPDLYVCRHDAPNLLFLNRGDGTFTEEAAAWGLAVRDASVHATFADYDGDGDLDCYSRASATSAPTSSASTWRGNSPTGAACGSARRLCSGAISTSVAPTRSTPRATPSGI